MPCNHKFRSYLNLERLNFEPTTLIVGTFNPVWPTGNIAEWFYGRIQGGVHNHNRGNHFWAVLPRIYEQNSLKFLGAQDQWKDFCREQKIAITDLISCIEDAYPNNPDHLRFLRGYSDNAIAIKFHNHSLVPIIELLQAHPTIKNIYLTRGIGDAFWLQKWMPIQLYCIANGICSKILVTPSDNIRFQLGPYNNLHPEAQLSREDYILMRWREQWHQI